jgi:cytochrome P450
MMRSDRTLSAAEQWEGTVAAIRLGETVMRLLEAAPGGPRETLFHAIASQTGQLYGQLTEAESAMTALHFLFGGYLSTEFLLCTGIRNLLLDDGAPWRTLQANPALLPQAVDEMRRFDTPLGVVDRYAAHALEWEGVSIPAGARLMGMLGAANHDERVFGRDAERFDITNEVNGKHLALGRGIHECIGKPLQARVVPLAVRGLMAAFPDLALASQAQPPWIMNPYFRSFTRLMVVRQPPRTRRWTR